MDYEYAGRFAVLMTAPKNISCMRTTPGEIPAKEKVEPKEAV
jgi:hypothetical protein